MNEYDEISISPDLAKRLQALAGHEDISAAKLAASMVVERGRHYGDLVLSHLDNVPSYKIHYESSSSYKGGVAGILRLPAGSRQDIVAVAKREGMELEKFLNNLTAEREQRIQLAAQASQASRPGRMPGNSPNFTTAQS